MLNSIALAQKDIPGVLQGQKRKCWHASQRLRVNDRHECEFTPMNSLNANGHDVDMRKSWRENSTSGEALQHFLPTPHQITSQDQ